MRGVSDVGQAPVSGNSSTGGWFGILGGTHEKDCVLFMSRLTNTPSLPYKIVIESWNTHASPSSQETLLRKTVLEDRERSEKDRRMYLLHSLRLTLFLCPTEISQPPFTWKY